MLVQKVLYQKLSEVYMLEESKRQTSLLKNLFSPRPPTPLRYLTLSYGGSHTSEEEITTQK